MPSPQAESVREMVRSMISEITKPGLSIQAQRDLYESAMAPLGVPAGTQVEKISAGGVPAEWISAPGAQSGRVLLYLHGGGYYMASCATHRDFAARLSKVAGTRVLLLDYRLAPEHPFPAAVEDATAAFRWLLKQGVLPGHISIGGDSAGGGLALAATMALRDAGQGPAAVIIVSGWMDMTFSGESYKTYSAVDITVTIELLKQCREWYIGQTDPPPILASPLQGDLRGLPPMIIHVGSDEILRDDSVTLAKQAQAAGVETEFEIWDGMWHCFQTAAAMNVPEAEAALDKIGAFIHKHT